MLFVKYDITELTLFWFAMLINEYTLDFQLRKSSKDAKFRQLMFAPADHPFFISTTKAHNGSYSISKIRRLGRIHFYLFL